ncbi:proteophosphoglycan ppg4 [Rhodotorula toruloides]|uniref:Proteophosphoglycan ppg4 n=1 Tax=Rhodotorula toruloides TaxID=5286 RepID=A0A511KB06_RHOTO|nr:proteophosphoglycan ppg4 [Rhodotorula toruloides]
MTSHETAYRPRLPTKSEEEKEKEQVKVKRERLFKRVRREQEEDERQEVKYNYSGITGIAYQDFSLGRSAPVKSRAAVDAQTYAARRRRQASTSPALLDSLPRLAECCVSVIVESYGETALFDSLDATKHREVVPRLLELLEQSLEADNAPLPYQVWLDIASRLGVDTPKRRRTYRGLVVSDADELDVLKDLNVEAIQRFLQDSMFQSASSAPSPPAFFLAYLDLSGDTTFTDGDIYKLRDPVSHFLSVLRLDGTSVTDGGLEWIDRAAKDAPQYHRLEVLSVRNLAKVTDDGIVRLCWLPNLRLFDSRGTGCSPGLRSRLNDALLSLPPSHSACSPTLSCWRVPRETRNDLATHSRQSPHLELQLFDPKNFSPSRLISLLHYLSDIESSNATTRAQKARKEVVKPLGVHLTALTRLAQQATPSAQPSDSRTAEGVYQAQLALRSAATHAAHHAAFGSVTSTMVLSRASVEEDGRAEKDKGAAFRMRDDAVAGRTFGGVGGAKGGRASLYEVGQRKVHSGSSRWIPQEREAFSDSETEDVVERRYKDAEDKAIRDWDEENVKVASFYKGKRPEQRGPRMFAIPPKRDGMLLRMIEYVPPWEEPLRRASAPAPVQQPRQEVRIASDGSALVKKRRRNDESATFAPSTPVRPLVSFPSSSSPASATPPLQQASSKACRPASLYTPRSDPKNIVRTTAALPKRSGLSAFRTKR